MSEETTVTATPESPKKKSNKVKYLICLIIAAIATIIWNKTDIKCSLGFDCSKDSTIVIPITPDSTSVAADTTVKINDSIK